MFPKYDNRVQLYYSNSNDDHGQNSRRSSYGNSNNSRSNRSDLNRLTTDWDCAKVHIIIKQTFFVCLFVLKINLTLKNLVWNKEFQTTRQMFQMWHFKRRFLKLKLIYIYISNKYTRTNGNVEKKLCQIKYTLIKSAKLLSF